LAIICCDLRLDDESVRVAVRGQLISASLTFALAVVLRSTHGVYMASYVNMPLAAQQDTSLSMMLSAGRWLLPASKPRSTSGLVRGDGNCPDGLTFVPWQSGKPLPWDVTVVHTLADLYVSQTSHSAASAAELAAYRKSAKYADLLQSYLFQSIAAETSSSMDSSPAAFFTGLGRKISSVSGEVREASFLFQRISACFMRRFRTLTIPAFCF